MLVYLDTKEMLPLSHVWKVLRTCVRANKSKDNSQKTSGATEAVFHEKRFNQELHKNHQNNWQDVLFKEQLQKSLEEWTEPGNNFVFNTSDQKLHEEIYNLLSLFALQPEIVAEVMQRLIVSDQFRPVSLFVRLEDFYRRWCRGEFIDTVPDDNLPQKKMLQMLAQNINIGLRQVDINTGLNVLILLLELHRYAQQRQDLKQKINFYPSGQPDTENFFTSQLLRIINYSDAIEIGNFTSVVGEFLRGANLGAAYLGDANLTGANFSGANLGGAFLGDANLTGANFSGANLLAANLGDANLSGANLTGADLKSADLGSSNLDGAILSNANLSRGDLNNANLNSVDLSGANLNGANLTGANLRDALLCRANLGDAILFGANLSDANLSDANLGSADFCRADLSGANLSYAILKGSNLSDSILFGTNLKGANLVAADLSYAKLNGAKLNNAQLNGAIILGADLNGVDLSGVNLNEADLSGVNLNEADLSGADLRDANLFGTDLSYANLNNADLSSANLSGAIFSGADLSHTNLSYAILGGADLSDANLDDMTWNENQEWREVRGLETAVNVPDALREKLGLR